MGGNQRFIIREQIRTASGLNIIAGLWLIASPFILNFEDVTDVFWSNIISGVAIAVLAALRAYGAYRQGWMSWLNVGVAIWVIISPWVLGYVGIAQAFWNSIIVGIVAAALAIWSALANRVPTSGAG